MREQCSNSFLVRVLFFLSGTGKSYTTFKNPACTLKFLLSKKPRLHILNKFFKKQFEEFRLSIIIKNYYDKTLDINECQSTHLNQCQQRCFNTFGSYKCGCNTGYRISADGKTCTGKANTIRIKVYNVFIHLFTEID